jgi:hypothetical protein
MRGLALPTLVERVEFECYNAINATDVEIEELKQMVLEKYEQETK